MKLYIPSCTLNFNNIFSTESISPKSFYSRRGFGNKRYYGVEANDLDDVILLYSKYPIFQVNDHDLENYPIVIEIETEDYAERKFNSVKKKDGVDVYVCSTTVYLNPFHCRVYFNSSLELQGALTKAEQSSENKFSKLYSNCFLIKQLKPKSALGKFENLFSSHEDEPEFEWDNSYKPSDVLSVDSSKIEDGVVDRIKGFLYCYLIGANTTISPQAAKLQAIARNLRNTLSAAFNSPSCQPTAFQDESLVENIKDFNAIFRQTDETEISNQKKIVDKLNKNPLNLSVEDCVKLLDFANVYSDFCAKLGVLPTFDANELWECFEDKSTETFDHVTERLEKSVIRIVSNERGKSTKRNVEELAEVNEDHVVQIKDVKHKEFYEKLVQSQIRGDFRKVIDEKGVAESTAIAFTGGRILKSLLGNKWEEHPANEYLTSLLSHFQDSTDFDLFAIDNEIPISFAAFCQKGNSIDRLLDYMEQKGINNTKYALGLYGATYGFASLPKTFTLQLINGDRDYYKNVYLAIYKDLFGRELTDAQFPQAGNNCINLSSSIGARLMENIDDIEPKSSKRAKVGNAITEAAWLEVAVQSPKAFMYIADDILGKRSNAYKALKESDFEHDTNNYTPEDFHKQIMRIVSPKLPQDRKSRQDVLSKIEQIIELEAKRQDPEAFLYILNDLLKPSDAAYKKIVKLINASSQMVKDGYKPSSTRKEIIYDDDAVEVIKNCNELGYYKNAIVKMFIDFQKSYRSGYYYKHPDKYKRNNEDVIDHFCKWCMSDKNAKSITRSNETSLMMNVLKGKLIEIYNDR